MSGERLDEVAAAQSLYGSTHPLEEMEPDTADEPEVDPESFEAQAAKVYSKPPLPEAVDHQAVAIAGKIDGIAEGFSSEELDDASREELTTVLPKALAATGMTSIDAGEFSNLVRSQINQPADERAVRAWEQESINLARNRNYSEADIRGAIALASKNPQVVWLMERTKLGNHPAMLEMFVGLARRARTTGRFEK